LIFLLLFFRNDPFLTSETSYVLTVFFLYPLSSLTFLCCTTSSLPSCLTSLSIIVFNLYRFITRWTHCSITTLRLDPLQSHCFLSDLLTLHLSRVHITSPLSSHVAPTRNASHTFKSFRHMSIVHYTLPNPIWRKHAHRNVP